MKNNEMIQLKFDKYVFPVPREVIKQFILDELHRLSKKTGESIECLKIEFDDNHSNNTIAYFSHIRNKPMGFCFHLNMFNLTTPNKIIDTVRHEFAHFLVCVRNITDEEIKAHGKEWKAVCKELDANASPHLNNDFTNHIIS